MPATVASAADTATSSSSTSSLERGRRSIEYIYGRNANLYTDVLGVSPTATNLELQEAFMKVRRPAQMIMLSDKATLSQKNFAEMKIDAATAAFRVLSQSSTRKLYDEALKSIASTKSVQNDKVAEDSFDAKIERTPSARTPSPKKRQWRRLIGKKSPSKCVTPSPPREQLHQQQQQVDMNIDETYEKLIAKKHHKDEGFPPAGNDANMTDLNSDEFESESCIGSVSILSGDRYDVNVSHNSAADESTAVSSYNPTPLDEKRDHMRHLNTSGESGDASMMEMDDQRATNLSDAVIIEEDDDEKSNHVSFSFSEAEGESSLAGQTKSASASASSQKSPPSALRKSKFDRSDKKKSSRGKDVDKRHRDRTPVTSQRRSHQKERYLSVSEEEGGDNKGGKKNSSTKKNKKAVTSDTEDESTIISNQSNYTYDNSTVLSVRSGSVMNNTSSWCGGASGPGDDRSIGTTSNTCMTNAVEEIQGSFLDFTTAVDQVWSAFLLKEDEVQEFVNQVDEGKWVLANGEKKRRK